jgi:hypothetical protein
VDNKVFGWNGFEKDVEIASGEAKRLRCSFGKLDIVSCWDGPGDTIHCAFQSPILEKKIYITL